MEPGSPEPALFMSRGYLWVAYRCANPDFPGWDSGAPADHPGFEEYFAVVRFAGAAKVAFGAPGEQGLRSHPLYGFGLEPYRFHRIRASAEEVLRHRTDLQHWVVTFHVETLEVVAHSAIVSHRRIDADSSEGALRKVFGFADARPN